MRALIFWALWACLVGLAFSSQAEPLTSIRQTGPSGNRVDLVVLGDGYAAAEQGKFAQDVEAAVSGLFAQPPFDAYRSFFNVHRVEVVSAESGADHPEDVPGRFRDTALGAAYNCLGIERLICVDLAAVYAVLGRSVAADQRDIVLVLVNDSEYGGSGGAVSVASLDSRVIEVVLHELGHSFGLLADEYDSSPPTCDKAFEPVEPNAALGIGRQELKWNRGGGPPQGWVQTETALPTSGAEPGRVGAYEGSKYCETGLYRPTFESKMRKLDRPFESVNSEQLVKRIYNLVAPIDAVTPREDLGVALAAGGRRKFVLDLAGELQTLKVTWKLDGRVVGRESSFTVAAADLERGVHQLRAEVRDSTLLVRNDPEQLLRDRREWTLAVDLECAGRPVTLVGTEGDDLLRGTPGPDVILGLGGDDRIEGRGGDDVLCGGKGADRLEGGAGDDQLFGQSGVDECVGSGGRDSAAQCETLSSVP